MENLVLRKVEGNDKKQFSTYLEELVKTSGALKGVEFLDGLDFDNLLEYYKEKEQIPFTNYFQKETPFYQYVLVEKDTNSIVGAVNIRPFLSERLDKDFEGNIGYSISSNCRGKGYGKLALSLAIKEFRKLNPNDKIVICCYKENIASRKIIEFHGGKLIEEIKGVLTPQKYIID